MLKLLSTLSLLFSAAAHSGHRAEDGLDCNAYPPVMSYHVHITYMLTNQDQIKEAGELRQEALVAFKDLLGPNPVCQGTETDPSGRYDNGRLCMIYDHDLETTLGPFPVGEWSMFVPVHYYERVVPWYVQHRRGFSLLVHPNTGCEYEDHSTWAQWTGDKWNMDMSIFTPETQTESFNQTRGTPENPVCVASAGMCAAGDPADIAFAPQVVCCFGLSCKCADESGLCYCSE